MHLQSQFLYLTDLLSLNDRPIFNKFSYRSTYHFNQWQYYYYSVLVRCQFLSSYLSYRSSEIMPNVDKILSFRLSLNRSVVTILDSSSISSDPIVRGDFLPLHSSLVLFSPLSESFVSIYGHGDLLRFNHVLNFNSSNLFSRSGRFFFKFFFKSFFSKILFLKANKAPAFNSSILASNISHRFVSYFVCFYLSVYTFLKRLAVRFFFNLSLFYSYKSLFRSFVFPSTQQMIVSKIKPFVSYFLHSFLFKLGSLLFIRSGLKSLSVISFFSRLVPFIRSNFFTSTSKSTFKFPYYFCSYRMVHALLFISQCSLFVSRSASVLKPRASFHLLFDHWVFNRFRSFFIKKGLGFQSDTFIQRLMFHIKSIYSVDPLLVISNVLYKLLVPMELRQVKIFGKVQSVPNRIRMKRQLFIAFKFLMTNVKVLNDRSNKLFKNVIDTFVDNGDAFMASSRYLKSILENRHLAVSYARRKDKARLRSIKSFHYTPVRSKFYMSRLSKRLKSVSKR